MHFLIKQNDTHVDVIANLRYICYEGLIKTTLNTEKSSICHLSSVYKHCTLQWNIINKILKKLFFFFGGGSFAILGDCISHVCIAEIYFERNL